MAPVAATATNQILIESGRHLVTGNILNIHDSPKR
jgi:hypothetical protein